MPSNKNNIEEFNNDFFQKYRIPSSTYVEIYYILKKDGILVQTEMYMKNLYKKKYIAAIPNYSCAIFSLGSYRLCFVSVLPFVFADLLQNKFFLYLYKYLRRI